MEVNGCKTHFIDSNVVIGFVIGWDNLKSESTKYFELQEFIRYSSERVYEECEKVLNNNKRWILQFVNKIHKDCEKKSSTNFILDLSKILDNIVYDICQQYTNECKKVKGALKGFSEKYENELVEVMKGNLKHNIFRASIVKAFNNATDNLEIVFDNLLEKKICPINLSNTLFSEYQNLQKIGLHGTDIKILLDSHFVSVRERVSKIGFITFDNGIIKVKSKIEKIICVMVLKPE
jgi:hypothetical protein